MKHREINPSSITIVVAALNEEQWLAVAVETALAAARQWFDEVEVLIFDDGSTDGTGAVADKLEHRHAEVRAYYHERPRCLGGVLRHGRELAQGEYFIYVDGKGATSAEALARIFAQTGKADLVIPYASNMRDRPACRRIVSWAYQSLLNALFGLRIRHYGNSILYRTAQLKGVHVRTDSYAFQAEAVIKLMRAGASCIQVPYVDWFAREGQKTKAFRWNNVAGVAKFLAWTLWDVYSGNTKAETRNYET